MMGRMARTVVRAMAGASWSPVWQKATAAVAPHCQPCRISSIELASAPVYRPADVLSGIVFPCVQRRTFHARPRSSLFPGEIRGLIASLRRFRKLRRRQTVKKRSTSEMREVELSVKVCIEESLPRDSEVLNIAEMLRLNVAMAMKIAFDGLQHSGYKTRDTSISDVGKYERIELNVLLCNDNFIRNLNKEWRQKDKATDLLSISRHIPDLDLPILILGDIVISIETAARQAEARGYKLLDEIRILLVNGLLNLLGFDESISDEAEREMAREEELILGSLGWKRKIPIKSSGENNVDVGSCGYDTILQMRCVHVMPFDEMNSVLMMKFS